MDDMALAVRVVGFHHTDWLFHAQHVFCSVFQTIIDNR